VEFKAGLPRAPAVFVLTVSGDGHQSLGSRRAE
jgi:hypothetical protein